MRPSHLDFTIRIRQGSDGEHSVQVDSPAGFGERRLGLSLEAVARRRRRTGMLRATRSLASVGGDREASLPIPPAAAELEMRALGRELFDGLLGDGLAVLFERSLDAARSSGQRLRLILKVDPTSRRLAEIHGQPWEYLFYQPGGVFVATQRETPVLRQLDVERPVPRAPIEDLRILAAASSPPEVAPLDLEREIQALTKLSASHSHLDLEVLRDASLDALRETLIGHEIHVLHYMGHGDFDPETGEGTLALTGDDGTVRQVSGTRIAQVISGIRSVRLVVLNACNTARDQDAQGENPFAGVGTALVRAGVPAVIAMQAPISDLAAIAFSEVLYRRLAAGDPLDVAMSEGRQVIHAKWEHFEWGTPVLFTGTSDLDFFPRPPVEDPATAASDREAAARRHRLSRLRRAVALATACALLAAGWWGTRPATEADLLLDLKVDGVTFQLADDAVLFEGADLRELAAADLGRVVLPALADPPRRTFAADGDRPLRVRLVTAKGQPPLAFDSSFLVADTWLELHAVRDLAYALAIDLRDVPAPHASAPPAELRIQTAGPLELYGLADAPRRWLTEPGSSIELAARGRRLDLDVVFRESADATVPAGLGVAALLLSRVEERTVNEEISHRRVSTVRGGDLVTAAGTRQVEEGELLRFSTLDGSVTSLRLHAGFIHFTFRGRVAELTTEPRGGAEKSLMPRRFETWWSEPRLPAAAGS